MRDYECECLECGKKSQILFKTEPYPEIGEIFLHKCKQCGKFGEHTRVITRRAAAELRRKKQEEDLRNSIAEKCKEKGFKCRFLYQSVIITTPVCDWSFDYHRSEITLYHESTVKINFANGHYAKSHVQFKDRKIKPLEVIEYISNHDKAVIKRRNSKL